ncbi:hypothetical protein HID58_013474, partial [Brassica napus]
NLVSLLGDPRLSLLIMAPGRVTPAGLVPGQQLGVSSDDEPGESVPPSIVWGIVRRGSNTPSGFSTSFLPGLIGFSSDLWVLALLVGCACPRDPIMRAIFFGTLGGGGVRAPPLERPRCRRGFRIPWTGSAIVSTWLIEDFESFQSSDPFRVYAKDWSPEWSFMWKMRYLIMLLGTPYLAEVFGVPRYLTTCGDDTCGPSPTPSWGIKLLLAKPAGAYEFSADPQP